MQTWLEKTQLQVTAQNALGKAISYLASNWIKLVCYTEAGYLLIWQSVRSGPSLSDTTTTLTQGECKRSMNPTF